MRRPSIVLLAAMIVFGAGVNRYIAAHKTDLAVPASVPTARHAEFALPGTMYVAQAGIVYSLTGTTFTALALPSDLTWMQPHALPDGTLLVVARGKEFTDLYHADAQGRIIAQLTHNHVSDTTIQLNHWVYYPTASADGSTILASYDDPKPAYNASFEEDLSIWAGTMNDLNGTRWTVPDPYTGGDIQPQLMPGGALLYATYAIAPNNHVESVIGIQKTPRSPLIPLTDQGDDCNAPALSPDGTKLAMICTSDTQSSKLEVASLNGDKLGTPSVLVDNCLCNAPTWAPDGSGLAYIAPSDASGRFQLWWLSGAGTAAAAAPRADTAGIDLDATSAPAWLSSASTAAASQ